MTVDPLLIMTGRDGCYTWRLQTGRRSVLAHPSDRCPLNPCQGRGQARLRVYMCRAPLGFAVVPRSQPGLTADLQGFRIGAPEGGCIF